MKIVVAPEEFTPLSIEIKCFLAGGITNCPNWQADVVKCLKEYDIRHPGQLDRLVVFNPRRDNFPIDDPNAAREQISWEFKWLQEMDLFSMWFSGGDSDQPICMYELGRNIQRMTTRFPDDWQDRILIMCDPDYRRMQDVKIQTELAFAAVGNAKPDIISKADPELYAQRIIQQFKRIEFNS